jgi:hypothetical protein
MAEDNLYAALIKAIFARHFKKGRTEFEFSREELPQVAAKLGRALPKNLGDVIYSLRYRTEMPAEIASTAGNGREWRIEPAGRSTYRFKLGRINRIVPDPLQKAIKIPDATPQIVRQRAMDDEQALLAIIRYNRLVDIFLGVSAFSLQNHLRTSVKDVGQIEVDELYVGVDRRGIQYVVPVQAKGGRDKISVIQTKQDLGFCAERYPDLVARAVSAQFMDENRVAMFELELDARGEIEVAEQKHYRLVPADDISPADLAKYRKGR